MFCPECGTKNEDEAVFCEECGMKLSDCHTLQSSEFLQLSYEDTEKLPKISTCPDCGEKNDEEAAFCSECGTKLTDESVKQDIVSLNLDEYASPQPIIANCIYCGEAIEDGDVYCAGCGRKTGQTQASPRANNVFVTTKPNVPTSTARGERRKYKTVAIIAGAVAVLGLAIGLSVVRPWDNSPTTYMVQPAVPAEPALPSVQSERYPEFDSTLYGNTPTLTPTILLPSVDTEWKQIYIDLVNENIGPSFPDSGWVQYALVYIDDDEIPELVIESDSHDDTYVNWQNSTLYTIYDGHIQRNEDITLYHHNYLSYIERENLFRICWPGHMGVGGDEIYTIENGTFVQLHSGRFRQIYDNGMPLEPIMFEYYWDGVKVSEYEYQQLLEQAFDDSKAIGASMYYSYSGIISAIEGTDNSGGGLNNETGTSQQNLLDSDYILPDSATRYLTDDDVQHLSQEELMYARNEIFARHGRHFDTDYIQEYFDGKTWYAQLDRLPLGAEPSLSALEWANIRLIQSYED